MTNKLTFAKYDTDEKGKRRKMALNERSAFLRQNNTVRINKEVLGF